MFLAGIYKYTHLYNISYYITCYYTRIHIRKKKKKRKKMKERVYSMHILNITECRVQTEYEISCICTIYNMYI